MPSSPSRAAFFQRLRAAVPAALALPPPYPPPSSDEIDRVARFQATTEAVGGTVLRVPRRTQLRAAIDAIAPEATRLVDPQLPIPGRRPEDASTAHDFADLDVVVLRGVVAVAEDAAVLVTGLDALGPPTSRLRAAPFLAAHMVVVVDTLDVEADLHAAMARPDVRDALDAAGFAVWISGPSKTADIEQTLVMGAHGPEALTVLLVDAP